VGFKPALLNPPDLNNGLYWRFIVAFNPGETLVGESPARAKGRRRGQEDPGKQKTVVGDHGVSEA
jgi:hypothetical protein